MECIDAEKLNLDKKDLPIGVFDSGVGGVSVLREIVRQMPNENIRFFGDSANAPYGTKTPERIVELTCKNVAHLYEEGIKAVVVACNTATSAAIATLREIYTDIPVVGIEPALKPAALIAEHPRVLVMATPMTVGGDKFHMLKERWQDKADVVSVSCPGLMEHVERGELEGEIIDTYLSDLLTPYLNEKVDAVVLGCTHYPFVRAAIKKVVGDVPVIDGSEGTARQLKRLLNEASLLTEREDQGKVSFEFSVPERRELAEKLLNM